MISYTSCKNKVKDADIKTAIETALKAEPAFPGILVDVKNGIATISGECKDEIAKAYFSKLVSAVKDVKSVVNNCTIAPPPVAEPVINATDEVLSSGLADALKDHPGLQYMIKDGKIVLSGAINKAKWALLKQTLDKLKSNGYDLTGLKIK